MTAPTRSPDLDTAPQPRADGSDEPETRPGIVGRQDVAPEPDGWAEHEARSGNAVPEARVAAMFDDIAPVYDRMNTLMTLGSDRRWRRLAVEATGLRGGESVIDVACGTGKLSVALAERVGPFGRVLGVDLSPAMVAFSRHAHPDLVQLQFEVGNALQLPAGDGEFDAATIAFGLRNLADFEAGFRELRRVVRPGGRVICLELSMPRPRVWGVAYHAIFRRSAPLLGSLFRRRSAYAYLPESLSGFPQPDQLVATMRRAGLVDVGFRRLALGAVALHKGRVPGS
jgi:demethylmenaquinone methyltransferase/2-methoxy-6-polyprenyl-1,4-benzoquinol methylase